MPCPLGLQKQRQHVPSQPQPLRLPHVLTTQASPTDILGRYLPPQAVAWVHQYLDSHGVHFRVARHRDTRLGDYRRPQPRRPYHAISINGDLPPYLFLWVFLHEAAHLENHLHHPHSQPHGPEWQAEYALLLRQHIDLFPTEIVPLIERYTHRLPLHNPTCRQTDSAAPPSPTLNDLQPGQHFALKQSPRRRFQALEKRRTRWICLDLDSVRKYLVDGSAEVAILTPSA